MLFNLLTRYVRFIIVAAMLAVSSMLALELIHYLVGYQSAIAAGFWSWLIYLIGLGINFQLQKRWVFATQHRPGFVRYAVWMLFSSFIVGLLSGVIFGQLNKHFPELAFKPSISLGVALAINSPVTFLGVSLIMRPRRPSPSH